MLVEEPHFAVGNCYSMPLGTIMAAYTSTILGAIWSTKVTSFPLNSIPALVQPLVHIAVFFGDLYPLWKCFSSHWADLADPMDLLQPLDLPEQQAAEKR